MIFEHTSKNKKVLLTVSLIVLLGGILAFAWPRFFGEANDRKDVQSLVETFGKRLKNVSLLAPREILTKSMEDNYGELVSSPVLIAEWVAKASEDPANVPGRLTSSPWPDRIEILNIEKRSDYAYEVKGRVIEITSVDVDGNSSDKRPITVLAEKRRDMGNRWYISGVTLDPYERGDTSGNFKNDQLEKAITNYLVTQKRFSWRNRDDSFALCVIENLDQENELFPFSLWVYCGEYVVEDGQLKNVSGSSGPAKIHYPNELSFYDLRKFSYEAPGDGSQYSEDVRKIFPENVRQKIFNFDTGKIVARIEADALANIRSWESIKSAVGECRVDKVWQTHARAVTAELNNGEELTAFEPEIDDIFKIVGASTPKCGEIMMGTE
ncbi:MAG: hypothetical protein WCT49_05745 [Candidatus Paceibacterota bacterium]|nr:hypothetical protein [Candidatus Paceibacterota bacterium]